METQTEQTTINLRKLYGHIQAYFNCMDTGHKYWEQKHMETIDNMLVALPNGSGFDQGVKLNLPACSTRLLKEKIVFEFSFHHLNENGYYDGWTDHTLIIRPAFQGGYHMHITGRNKNGIKEYFRDIFNDIFEV